jgi:uncharacterized protein (TIGR02231 family)
MKTLRPGLLLLAALSFSGPAAAQPASHAISAVTVFPDRAAVTRTIEVELLAGANEVTVIDLPLALLPESVRVDGSAASAVRLGAVEVRQRYGQGRDVDAERRLADEIEALHDRRAALDDEIRAAQAQLDFIDALRRDAPDVANKEREQGLIDPTIWQQAWSTVSAGTADALKRIREAQQAQRAIDRELQAKQQEQALIASGSGQGSVEVAIKLEAEAAGRATLALTYQVPNASWNPLYEARLDSETGEVLLTQAGEVRQHTGEDWTDVAVTLSTARPALGALVPELEPWFIRVGEPVDRLTEQEGVGGFYRKNEADELAAAGARKDPAAAPAPETPIERGAAAFAGSEFAAEYKIAGRGTIPADGSSHRFTIADRTLSSTLSVVATPRLAPVGYLIAAAKHAGEEPLLPGPVSVFRDGSYVGLAHLALTAPGEEVTLSFGADDKVKIEYRLVSDGESQEGLISTDRRIERQYLTKVANHHARALEITVLDQMPVSQDERIEVELLNSTTKPTETDLDDRKGVLAWRYLYQPEEQREIHFGYAVTAPEDVPILGLATLRPGGEVNNLPRP